jgi:hypothetical protein
VLFLKRSVLKESRTERLEQWLSDEENFEKVGLLAPAGLISDLAGVFVLRSV